MFRWTNNVSKVLQVLGRCVLALTIMGNAFIKSAVSSI